MHFDRVIAIAILATLAIDPGTASARTQAANAPRATHATTAAPIVRGGGCGDPGCTFLDIPDDGYDGSIASMACSARNVSGSSQDVITHVSLSFGITHTYVGDLTVKLFTPHSGALGLISRPGTLETADDGNDDASGDSSDLDDAFPLRFDDAHPTSAEDLGAALDNGSAACRDDGLCDFQPAPGSIATPPASLADLRGQRFDGTWILCVGDSYVGDVGTLMTSWDLDIDTAASLATFTVTPGVGTPGGRVDPPDAQTVYDGNRATFTLLPDPGFHVDGVGGTCGGDLAGDVFTTDPVDADCTMIANFASDTPTHEVSPSIGTPGGSIAPATPQSVVEGHTASFTLTPDPGFHVDTVGGTCDGDVVGNVFTTAPVLADCTVIANFAADGSGCQVGNRWCGTPEVAIADGAYDGSLASMACSAIHADTIPAGDVATGVGVSVGITHYRAGELTAKLVSPSGTVLGLFSRPGNDEGADNGSGGFIGDYSDLDAAWPLRFADVAPHDPEAMGAMLADDLAVCRDDGVCDFAPNPDSIATPPARFADLRGEPAAGTWTLCVGDSEASDTGEPYTGIFDHWTITILHAAAASDALVTPLVGTGGGAISPAAAQLIPVGDTASFALTPDPGFHLDTIGGTCGGTLAGDVFTTEPVVADCEVIANFAADGAGCTSGDTFCSTRQVAIPDDAYDGSLGSMACSSIGTGAIPADDIVTRLSIRVALDHSDVGELTAKLIGPAGGVLGVFSRPGLAETSDDGRGNGGWTANLDAAFPLVFDDVADNDAESMGATLGDDDVVCADDDTCAFYPNPGAVASQPDAFTGFLGQPAAGTWTLCVGDSGDSGSGELAAWDITIEHAAPGLAYQVEPHIGTPGGTIRPSEDVLVPQGVTATFRLSPDPGFHLDTVGGTCTGTLEGNRFTTTPISAGCSVVANFAPDGGGCNVGNTFCSTRVLPILDNAYDGSLASMTCSAIDASAIPAEDEVANITLTAAITHARAGDLNAKLVSPDGTVLGVFSRPGLAESADDGSDGSGDDSNLDATYPLTFDDAAPNDAETIGATLDFNDVICRDDANCTYFPNPDSIATPPAGFADLIGEPASGTWTLCVGDSMWAESGSLENWRITIAHAAEASTHVVTPLVGTPSGSLAPPDPQEVFEGTTVQFNVNPAPGFHIESVGGTCGGTLDGDLYTTAPVTADCTVLADFAVDAAGSFPPDEDFDALAVPALPAAWTTGASGAGVAWQTTSDFTHSAPNAAFAPELATDADMWLDSPPFIAGAGETLSFRHHYNLERFFDGAVLEISIAGGAYTDILAAGGSFLANGYDTDMQGSSSPLLGRNAWSGQSAGFIETVVELPAAAAGQLCRLRFRTADDLSSTASGDAGWWIDTIHLSGSGATTWTLTPSVGTPAGTIDPATPVVVTPDDTVAFTLIPDAGYHIESVGGTCGGTLAGNVFTSAPAAADCTVIANFRADTHTVDASVGVPAGTISPAGPQTVDDDDTIAFTLIPDTGFHIDTIDSTCGGSLAGNVFTTAPVIADCSVVANFAIDMHIVTPGIGAAGGTIAPDTPQTVEHGSNVAFTLTPDTGFHIDTIDSTCGGSLAGNVFTTAPVVADCSVVANFAIDTHVVTPGIGAAGGTIAPDTPQTVEHGSDVAFTLTPDAHHYVAAVGGTCGGTLAGNEFTTAPVTADCTVIASFGYHPDATITPDDFTFTVAADETAIDVLAIANAVAADLLTWSVIAREPAGGTCGGARVAWLEPDPAAGSLVDGANVFVLLTANPGVASLAPGEYAAELCVATNDPTQTLVVIPAGLTVTPANGVFCSGFESGESGLCAD